MFKAVICCVNSKYIHSSLAPWYLLAGTKKYASQSIDACVVEGTINEKEEKIVERIAEKNPDAVSFCCYIWNIKTVKSVAKRLKELLPELKIIFGGPEVSYNSRQVLFENGFVDFVLCGEGEKALCELLLCLKEKKSPPDGLSSFVFGGRFRQGRFHTAPDELSPFCKQYLESLGGRIAYIESSRGCPYHCAFCLSGTEQKVRFFDIERVKSEMLLLSQSGAKTIKFVDRTFNCNKKRAKEILLFIKENYGGKIPDGVCFHFEIAADILDEELLELIGQMPLGSVQFEAGIQSFNPKTLESINRKTDMKRLWKNLQTLISFHNCHTHIDLIAGLPFENLESFKESFNKAFSLHADMLQLGFLKILYGSCMQTQREKYPCDYHHEPPYEVVSTPFLSKSELEFLHGVEDTFERLYNSGRFHRSVDYIVSQSKKTPFDVFASFAESLGNENKSMPLDSYTSKAFEFFSSFESIDKMRLRDLMITDRIATNSSGIIPDCLKIKDEKLKRAKHELSLLYPMKKGVMRSVAILYSEKAVIFCDYENKNRVTGEYELRRADLTEVLG